MRMSVLPASKKIARSGGRGATSAIDAEGELALRHVAVDGEHAPHDAIRARPERRHRYAQQRAVGLVDAAVAEIGPLARGVEYLRAAVRGLERAGEPQTHLRRRALHADARARVGAVQHAEGTGGGGTQREQACGDGETTDHERTVPHLKTGRVCAPFPSPSHRAMTIAR